MSIKGPITPKKLLVLAILIPLLLFILSALLTVIGGMLTFGNVDADYSLFEKLSDLVAKSGAIWLYFIAPVLLVLAILKKINK